MNTYYGSCYKKIRSPEIQKAHMSYDRWRRSISCYEVLCLLYTKIGGVCECGKTMILPKLRQAITSIVFRDSLNDFATLDHILSISHGGKPKDISNLQVLCYECNVHKGGVESNSLLYDFLETYYTGS